MTDNLTGSGQRFRLDVHHHRIPDIYVATLEKQGMHAGYGAGFPK